MSNRKNRSKSSLDFGEIAGFTQEMGSGAGKW